MTTSASPFDSFTALLVVERDQQVVEAGGGGSTGAHRDGAVGSKRDLGRHDAEIDDDAGNDLALLRSGRQREDAREQSRGDYDPPATLRRHEADHASSGTRSS